MRQSGFNQCIQLHLHWQEVGGGGEREEGSHRSVGVGGGEAGREASKRGKPIERSSLLQKQPNELRLL